MNCDECPKCITDLEKKVDELEQQVKEAYEAGQLMCKCQEKSEAVVPLNDLLDANRRLQDEVDKLKAEIKGLKTCECAEGNQDCMCCPEHTQNWRASI